MTPAPTNIPSQNPTNVPSTNVPTNVPIVIATSNPSTKMPSNLPTNVPIASTESDSQGSLTGDGTNSSQAVIYGGIAGAVVVVALLLVLVYCCLKKRKTKVFLQMNVENKNESKEMMRIQSMSTDANVEMQRVTVEALGSDVTVVGSSNESNAKTMEEIRKMVDNQSDSDSSEKEGKSLHFCHNWCFVDYCDLFEIRCNATK